MAPAPGHPPTSPTEPRSITGIGLGLRAPLVPDLLARAPEALRWLEVSPENYMGRGGGMVAQLAACAARWPVVTHGLTLSLGGCDPLDGPYLDALAGFIARTGSPWHSDHLCFGSVGGVQLHDLLPLPFTRSAARHVADRVDAVRRALGVPLAVENVSAYAHPGAADFDEADFLSEVCRNSDARLLLDVNNVYVNARNHGFDPYAMVARLPLDRVVQIHVAGHWTGPDGLRVDTHGEPVCDDVYDLLDFTLRRTGPVPVLLERDQNFPPWDDLVAELQRLDALWHRATRGVGSDLREAISPGTAP